MPTALDIQLLQRLHSLLRQKTELSARLARGPRAIQIAETNCKNFLAKIEELCSEIKSIKMKADDKQLQLSEREAHIAKLEGQRNECKSNRDYQLLSDQIAADEKANEVLQDEILELLEKIESKEAEDVTERENLKVLEADRDAVQTRIDKEMEVVSKDLADVETELADSQNKLPNEVKGEFLRLTGGLAEDALSQVSDKTCGHCFQIINAQMYSQLVMAQPVFCGGCGSLMYLPKSQTADEGIG